MTAPAATDDPLALSWEKVAFYLRHALGLFGDPTKLAQALWISAHDHKLFSSFIRPLEEMVRHLIFIMALELSPMTLPPSVERKYAPRLGMPTNTGASFDVNQSETWRVSFRLARSAGIVQHAPQHADEDADAPDPRISSAPSAQRLEALLRAYEQREKFAAALARKIAREAAAAHRFLTRPDRQKSSTSQSGSRCSTSSRSRKTRFSASSIASSTRSRRTPAELRENLNASSKRRALWS